MTKTNLQIEYECALNWLTTYRRTGRTGAKVTAMRRHARALEKKLRQGKQG